MDEIEINENLYNAIKETFDEEIIKLFKKIVKKYGDEYLFTLEDLTNFYKEHEIKFKYKKAPKTIKKTNVEKGKEANEDEEYENDDDEIDERCCARIWMNGYMNKKKSTYGGRCQRKKINESDYCHQHLDHLVHGRYDEEPSIIIKGFYIKENSNTEDSE